ncbi:MAG: DUF1707 domain-containing protein [Spirochaetia bacterium]
MEEYGVNKLRGEILDRLASAYAEGKLTDTDYEERIEKAHDAETISGLTSLVKDVEGTPAEYRKETEPAVRESSSDNVIFKFMGDREILPHEFEDDTPVIITILGDQKIDLRTITDRRTIILNNFSLIGDTKIILPPGYKFKKKHTTLLGDFKFRKRESIRLPEGSRGTIIMKGFKLIGDVTVTPGEYYLDQ